MNNDQSLVLNLAPISFNKETISIGRLPYLGEESYGELRRSYRQSHVFRFDQRDEKIVNVSLRTGIFPQGDVTEEPTDHHLLLLGKVFQHSALEWLKDRFTILRRGRPLVFWGRHRNSKLLSRVLQELGLTPYSGLEVVARYSLDTRILQSPHDPGRSYLALLIELETSNILDISLQDLLQKGLDIRGRLVCARPSAQESEFFRPKPELLGIVAKTEGEHLLLTDNEGTDRVLISEVMLEARQENLEAVIQALYPRNSRQIVERLKELRTNYSKANSKIALIQQTLDVLREKLSVSTGDGLRMALGSLLTPKSPLFPQAIQTDRPNLLFGPQGRNADLYPDPGIQKWGPFKYMHNDKNDPLIAVLCEAQNRGRVEQFIHDLWNGLSDEVWSTAAARQRRKQENPYRGGLTGKFRLGRITLEYEEVSRPDAASYRQAASRLLARLPKAPDLAIVQTRKSFEILYGETNPYLIVKATFMQAGVPVQAVKEENIEADHLQLARILNNIGLASYAKLGGVPWVISTRNPTSHELVVGMGYTEMSRTRLSERTRYVGITTLFQGDGRYQVWGLTREVEFEDYATALLENLNATVRYVQEQNDWRPGDSVRLIFHVYKPLKKVEMSAIKELVSKLTSDKYNVKYAFLDLSSYHPFHIFDPSQKGQEYGYGGTQSVRGEGVPQRGLALQLDKRTALLQLTGPRDLKLDYQGLPQPLKIELHPESDFDDLIYLVRQVFHFTYMSWRSFFPASEPVTIAYSRRIAKTLGSLKPINGWNSSTLTVGPLRGSMWFL